MKIALVRYVMGQDSTGGAMYIDGDFECYTVEDQERRNVPIPLRQKIYGETAIPRGTYDIGLRDVGGFHQRYLTRYGDDFHKGMLELQMVPNFKYILIHSGNTDDDTAGCLLVGNTIQTTGGESMIPPGKTRPAYKELYPKVRDAIMGGDKVTIEISGIEH